MLFKDVKHVLDMRLDLISIEKLDDEWRHARLINGNVIAAENEIST